MGSWGKRRRRKRKKTRALARRAWREEGAGGAKEKKQVLEAQEGTGQTQRVPDAVECVYESQSLARETWSL